MTWNRFGFSKSPMFSTSHSEIKPSDNLEHVNLTFFFIRTPPSTEDYITERRTMNELQIFNSEEFGDIRTVTIENEPWLVGKDVATALGYSNASKAVSSHVGEDDRILKVLEADSQNGNVVKTQTALINESGLYALIFGSKLESAKRFKHWVTSEVLPAIRKTGSYQKPMTIEEQLQIRFHSLVCRILTYANCIFLLVEYKCIIADTSFNKVSRNTRRIIMNLVL